MSAPRRPGIDAVPLADLRFFEVFLPREIKLMHYHSTPQPGEEGSGQQERFFGLVLIRLEPTEHVADAGDDLDMASKMRHLLRLLTSTIRYSDIPGQISPLELLAVIREIEPGRTSVIAQRLLSMASRSRPLTSESVNLRVGYLAYPLSTEPDLAPTEWTHLVDLTRRLSRQLGPELPQSSYGYGLIRGPEMGTPTIPEIDIVGIATTDLRSLIEAELLQLEPINLDEEL